MIKDILKEVTILISNLVTRTFVIERQPPQVLRTNSRFSCSVHLLVGDQLQVQMSSPSVYVRIISESLAKELLYSTEQGSFQMNGLSSGVILNGRGRMEYDAVSGHVSATFRNLQLKSIKRTER